MSHKAKERELGKIQLIPKYFSIYSFRDKLH
jgi:hypothetical protein